MLLFNVSILIIMTIGEEVQSLLSISITSYQLGREAEIAVMIAILYMTDHDNTQLKKLDFLQIPLKCIPG